MGELVSPEEYKPVSPTEKTTAQSTEHTIKNGIAKPKRKRRKYTPDEIAFIVDEKTTPNDIRDMFELDEIKAAYRLRNYFKRRLSMVK
jgi:hypothetical protein